MRLKSKFSTVVACGRHRDTTERALSLLWEASITWTLCVIDRGWARPRHRSWTPCGGGSAGSGMGDAGVDRGWAGRSHPVVGSSGCRALWRRRGVRGLDAGSRARRRGGCSACAAHGGVGDARGQSERARGRVLVEAEELRQCDVAETAPVRRCGGGFAGFTSGQQCASRDLSSLPFRDVRSQAWADHLHRGIASLELRYRTGRRAERRPQQLLSRLDYLSFVIIIIIIIIIITTTTCKTRS
jgi:hypothetical protein